MYYTLQFCLLLFGILSVYGNEICYDEVGCFNNDYPWFTLFRPFPMPASPEQVNTTFYFCNRIVNKSLILTKPIIQMHPEFDARKPTFFITHGYSSDSNTEWFYNLTDAILSKVDGNVFAVDWSKGSSGSYFSASANTRVVASEIERVIHMLEVNNSLNVNTVHLIGHSLGSHIMSYVGKNFTDPPVHRITALDPAQPGFQGKNPQVRLNKGDATFIDVVHTDGRPFLPFLGLGMTSGVGDVDFFINGGKWQPNCALDGESFPYKTIWEIPKITISILYNLATCSHTRAPRYMAAMIKESCSDWAHRYNIESASLRWKSFVSNEECDENSCTVLGLNTTHFLARGNFAMETTGTYPFCINSSDGQQKMTVD